MSATHNTFRTTVSGILILSMAFVSALASRAIAQKPKKRPSLKQVDSIARAILGERDGYQPGDLINQKDVKRVLKALTASGWQPADQKKLITDTLSEKDDLVRTLSTPRGVKYMRKVSGYNIIYDRMDRVSRVSGGKRMLEDITKLPDGQKISKQKRPNGVPGFLDLLPKKSSGKVRAIKNYDQPTGRIYTEEQLLERLKESYEGKSKKDTKKS